MSRHSKNNKASSVFTYGERKMLTNQYGTVKQRIGQDSQKPFESCYICLQKVKEPRSCQEGHIFCHNCIIENMVTQKKKIEMELKEWEQKNQLFNVKMREEEKKKKEKEIEEFEKTQVDLRCAEVPKTKSVFEKNEDQETQKKIIIEKLKGQEEIMKKPGMIKANFWMPENTQAINTLMKEKPCTKIKCPGDNKHTIKPKQLLKVNFESAGEIFVCWICRKELKYQKICMLAKCGHVMCKACFELTSNKVSKCPVCNIGYDKEDIINLKEAYSAFAQHNAVEVEKYTPAFAC